MSIPDRAPSSIWLLRREQFYPAVRTGENETICIFDDTEGWIRMSRKDARLLAKRINQCLDDTAKR